MANEITVTLAWSTDGANIHVDLATLTMGSTIQQAIEMVAAKGLTLPADWQSCKVGIYGKLKARDTVLRDKDRIELHRALIADPKEARRLRAKNNPLKKKQKSG